MSIREFTPFDFFKAWCDDMVEANVYGFIPGVIFACFFWELALPGFITYNLIMAGVVAHHESTYTKIESD